MYWEKKYVIVMTFCFAFLVFISTSFGNDVLGRIMLFGFDVHKDKLAYFEKIELRGVRYDKKSIAMFEKMDNRPMQKAVFFSDRDKGEGILKGSLIIHNKEDLLEVSEYDLSKMIDYGYARVIEGKGSGDFHLLDVRLGLDKLQLLRLTIDKASHKLRIEENYEGGFAFNNVSTGARATIEKEIIEAIDYVYLLKISKVPFSEDHVVAKAYVDGQLKYSKKKEVELLLKEKTGAKYLSVIYNQRGTVVDRTIGKDPLLKELELTNKTFNCSYDLDLVMKGIKTSLKM